MTDHTRGALITGLGALLLSFDTLLLRLAGGAPGQMAVWRGALMFGAGLAAWAAARAAGRRLGLVNGGLGLAVAACYGAASALFVAAVALTGVANMLVIVATAPLWAAAGAALVLGEATPPRTWAACLAALAGIGLVAWPGLAGGAWLGDAAALLAALCMAAAFVLSRRARASLALAPALGGLFCATALFPFAGALAFPEPRQTLAMVAEGAALVPLALGLIAAGPRYLGAAEVGLFLLLETALGPAWVWAALGERPSGFALLGGGLVLLTLAAHALPGRARPARAGAPA